MAKREAVQVAQAMLSGSLDLVTGCRRLCDLRHQIGAGDSEIFLPIVGFESETDDYPLGPVRARYNKKYVEKLDQEIRDYVERAGPGVLGACRRIVESLGGE